MLCAGGCARAGEPCFLPQRFRTARPIANPTEYTRLWVSEVAGRFQGGVCEARAFLTPLTLLGFFGCLSCQEMASICHMRQ
jgi:hypothetical protein